MKPLTGGEAKDTSHLRVENKIKTKKKLNSTLLCEAKIGDTDC